ncbi:MFS transporter [Gordonia sp. HY002]|uniref:MFS transporter n=1 Tax=Gordonia zhenghanii TaxID=2911516 RepID=UPI001EEFDA67|nr:MFS transporter [Gordonia zhenghanii]MCF8572103.1 MFS transporter [Gordonia zhenghanii]MCF8602977.1 MFS transporter [Gordonia zhenghanii]
MTTDQARPPETGERASWLPLVCFFFAQVLMSFNVSALPVSIGGMVDDFDVAPTTVSTTIVAYGIAVAALVMLGGKLGQRIGWVKIFRIVVFTFACSSVLMIVSQSVTWAIAGQAVAGASAAFIVPALVALIAENYKGDQQANAVGSLGSARAISGMSAFFLGGALGSLVGWRPVFMIVLVLAVIVFALSFTLRPDTGDRSIDIDVVASVLIGVAIVLLTVGFNNLNAWGVFFADDAAPFDLVGVSPAPILIIVGLILGQAFFLWTRRRQRSGRVPLVDLSVLGSSRERAAVYAMFIVVAMEAALNFTVPLYIQIVQGRSPFDTSLAMIPFNLTVFVTAMLVVRVYKTYSPRMIGMASFILTTVALVWLAFVVTNNWQTMSTIIGLIVFGIGQGALVTLVFNVLVTSAPKERAGDVGSIRGTTQNLASAVGTATIGALLVSLLGFAVASSVAEHPELPDDLVSQVNLDNVNFVSNDSLRETLATQTTATPAQIDAAIEVNEDSRLSTLKYGLLILAGLSATAILPASRLPAYRKGEIPEG